MRAPLWRSLPTVGLLAGLVLLCLTTGWYVFPPPVDSAVPASAPAPAAAPGRGASTTSSGSSAAASPRHAGDSSPSVEDIQRQLLLARVRHGLQQAWQRSASQSDFALTPGRIVAGLLEKRCVAAAREQLEPCRALLFALLKERLALPDDVTAERLWDVLERVDAEYRRQVVARLEKEPDLDFLAAFERFRQARRELAGPALDAKLFGLADDILLLPSRADGLAADPTLSADGRRAAWQQMLHELEREHQVQLAAVVEPLELAKLELRLEEAAGPLTPQQRQAVLERHLGAAAARQYLEHEREQQERDARLEAFNRERERLLQELAASGLTPEQVRQRMPELDRQLFARYGL